MIDVSRETTERLQIYSDLLQSWTKKINLIAPSTVPDLRRRHIEDSTQLFPLAQKGWKKWADLGSGGGLPGIVIAILAAEAELGREVILVESDARKCAFLRAALRETGVPGQVVQARVEELSPLMADVVSARALAPLKKLIGYARPHLNPGGTALFPKGRQAQAEIDEALERWSFACEKHSSNTDADGVILRIGDLS